MLLPNGAIGVQQVLQQEVRRAVLCAQFQGLEGEVFPPHLRLLHQVLPPLLILRTE